MRLVVFATVVACGAAQICNNLDKVHNAKMIPAVGHGTAMPTYPSNTNESDKGVACIEDKERPGAFKFDCTPPENDPQAVGAVVYLLLLLWTFLGVGVIADVFMGAIEVITSKASMIETKGVPEGEVTTLEVRFWNPTVANLTLMALGSSAPEILISVIEILGDGFHAGAMGPGTIVGSAAFNLFIIIGVCVIAIPPKNDKQGETGVRKIADLGVYSITAAFSVLAYLWLLVIVDDEVVQIWEGVVSFLFFPFLVALAYMADIGLFSANRRRVEPEPQIQSVRAPGFSGEYKGHQAAELLKGRNIDMNADPELAARFALAELEKSSPKSRAYWRIHANRRLLGNDNTVDTDVDMKALQRGTVAEKIVQYVGFASDQCAFLENCGEAEIVVVREPELEGSGECTVKYKTIPGTAKEGEDYGHVEGTLTFGAGEYKKSIKVPIVDDDALESDEYFNIVLSEPTNVELAPEGGDKVEVKIIDDDAPGHICFATTETGQKSAEYEVPESIGKCKIKLVRQQGAQGELKVRITSVAGTATEGIDYKKVDEVVTFTHGELEHHFEVEIINDERYERKEYFTLTLAPADENQQDIVGGIKHATINIKNDDEMKKLSEKVADLMNLNMDKLAIGNTTWKDQFADAIELPDKEAGKVALILTILGIPWKLFFAFCPPPNFCGGWLCFVVALMYLTLVSILISDLASLLGCCLGLKDAVTAITFVALGTSLPDTFASKSAAKAEKTADSSIGNVTGSNSVNVFLGLGLPWMIAAIYWQAGLASTEEVLKWKMKYLELDKVSGLADVMEQTGSSSLFVVRKGDLSFSVILFSTCAAVCILTLALRRKLFGFELGGKATYPTFFFFILLWFVYVLMSSLKTYGKV